MKEWVEDQLKDFLTLDTDSNYVFWTILKLLQVDTED